MSAMAEFGRPDFAGFLHSCITLSAEGELTADEVRRSVDAWLAATVQSHTKLKSLIKQTLDFCEARGSNGLVPDFDQIIANLQTREQDFVLCMAAEDSEKAGLMKFCATHLPDFAPYISKILSRIAFLESDAAETLRDARWRLMAARVQACPGQPVGPIHGDVAGMDDYLASVS